MAKEKTAAPAFEAGVKYRVRIDRPVELYGRKLKPSTLIEVDGENATTFADAIIWSERV